MTTAETSPRTPRRAPRRAGWAVGVSIGLHALALAGASVLMAGTAVGPREREAAPVVLRLDLRQDRFAPAPLEVQALIATPVPDLEPLPIEPPEPLDRDAWAEPLVVVTDYVITYATRRDAEFPEPAGGQRGIVRVPRRAASPGAGAGTVGLGTSGGEDAGASTTGAGDSRAPSSGPIAAGDSGTGGASTGADAALRAIHRPSPEYPSAARRRGEQGTVGCRLHVRTDGSVELVEIRASSGSERLDRAAVEALAHWRFEPALRQGIAIASLVNQDVRFALRGG